VSFKDGIAYGLSLKKEGSGIAGIYELQERKDYKMEWKLIVIGDFISFEALNDNSGYDFIILK